MNIKVDVNLTAPELVESINRLVQVLPGLAYIKEEKEGTDSVRIIEPSKEVKTMVRKSEPEVREEPKKP